MYSYSFIQWLLFFYIYCFLGWCWETSYVSIKKHKFTNRGFIHGPFLPIYGSGAIIVLISTLPVKHNLILVFIFGMISATILEYITGVLMETIFKVRYWDYSNQPFNINGHICLISSLAWGMFSIFMIKVLHNPIEKFVLKFNYDFVTFITFILTIGIVIDMTISIKAALDLKNIITKITESNEELIRMQKRLDVIIAILDNDKQELQEKIEKKLENYKKARENKLLFENLSKRFEFIEEKRNQFNENKQFESFKSELEELKNKYIVEKNNYDTKHIDRNIRILLKNYPNAKSSNKFSEVFEEFKKNIK